MLPLEREEELVDEVRGIGSAMYLTSERIIVARDGVERRPRTGIQSFPLESIRLVRLERGSGPSARVVVWSATGQEAVSMFVEARLIERAEAFVASSRTHVAQHRRTGAERSAGSDRPPDPS